MSYSVKVLIFVVGWSILFVLIRPLALLALILFPVVWLVSIPLRFVVMGMQAVLALMRAVWFLPARLLGFRKSNA
jgi:hypothetical protein